jgi:halocyanin-like protein
VACSVTTEPHGPGNSDLLTPSFHFAVSTTGMNRPSRRRVLATTGAALAAGLAGCTGGDGGDGGGGGGGGSVDIEVSAEAETRVENFLTADPSADNYDSISAKGGSSTTVAVGAEGNGGTFAYAPAAIAVEQGTTVNWEWQAESGRHNVESTGDSDFGLDSGDPKTEDSYEFTFEEAGVALYECIPHKSLGMKGAVVVVASGG